MPAQRDTYCKGRSNSAILPSNNTNKNTDGFWVSDLNANKRQKYLHWIEFFFHKSTYSRTLLQLFLMPDFFSFFDVVRLLSSICVCIVNECVLFIALHSCRMFMWKEKLSRSSTCKKWYDFFFVWKVFFIHILNFERWVR